MVELCVDSGNCSVCAETSYMGIRGTTRETFLHGE